MIKTLLSTAVVLLAFLTLAQSPTRHIQTNFETSELVITSPLDKQYIWADSFLVVQLDFESMNIELNGSDIPHRNEVNPQTHVFLSLPSPDGTTELYRVVRNTTMHPDLQATFPETRTYDVVGVNNRILRGKIDISPQGFHAMIFNHSGGTFFIDPVQQLNNELHMVYFKKHFTTNKSMSCSHDHDTHSIAADIIETGEIIEQLSYASCQLRTYRLALAATGEYTIFHGGTVALAAAAQITTMNRVNGIYEKEIAITMELVPNNNLLIFTDPATDPYTNNDAFAMLDENITTCNAIIGVNNYDIGHVFGAGFENGVAWSPSVCNNSFKGGGVTLNIEPLGDPFDVDYVSHEMGHQFSASHTQNNNCNRNNPTAMEPGSGSTILGYAGICAPNVQNNSDAYFHAISLQQMGNYISGFGGTCANITNIANQAPTITSTNGGITIPVSTPFALTATATDPDGDNIFYRWEQLDNEVSPQNPILSTNDEGPNFRSFEGTTNPTRYFPSLNLVSTNTNYGALAYRWQRLPSVSRTMNFRVTAHDDHAIGGCSDYVNTTVTFDASAGPFVVTNPNATGINWPAFSSQTVTWNVANTTNANIDCQFVNIYLSTNSGLAFPTLLASNVPNTGSAVIAVPNLPNTTSRVMVQAANGTFFDMSDNNFTISAPINGYEVVATNSPVDVCSGNNAQFNFDVNEVGTYNSPVTMSVSGLPVGASASWSTNPVTPGNSTSLNVNTTNVAEGSYNITIDATSAAGPQTLSVNLIVNSAPTASVNLLTPSNSATGIDTPVNFTWSASPTPGVVYQIDIATNSSFSNIVETQSGISGLNYQATSLSAGTQYFWRVRASNTCGASPFSDIFSFTSSNCAAFASTDVPVTIPDNAIATVTSTLNITQSGTITNVDVLNLIGTHTWVADLYFTLISPQGTSVFLYGGICNPNTQYTNFNFNFSDNAAPGTIPCPPTTGLTYQPAESLADFIGEEMQGVWTLSIFDDFPQDGGELQSWSLNICFESDDYNLSSNNSTLDVCAGSNANFNVNVEQVGNYTDPVTLSFSGLPSGASASWSNNPVNPGNGSVLTVTTSGVAAGSYPITVDATSTSGQQSLALTLNVSSAPNVAVNLISPAQNANGLNSTVDFSWSAVSGSNITYEIDIASSSDFLSIVESQNGISGTSYTSTSLSAGQIYFWRVRASNNCGAAPYSDTRSFTTESCLNIASSNVPVIIPASGTPTVTSTINITEQGIINNIDVLNLTGLHTWVSDLVVRLISPAGTQVVLFSEICGNNQNFNLNFSDDAAPGNIPCPPITGLTYQPVGSLANFNGEQMQGTWTLQIQDLANLDGGELQSWSLNICYESGFEIAAINPTVATCTGDQAAFNFDITEFGGYNQPVNLSFSGLPTNATASWTTNPVTPNGTTSLSVNTSGVNAGSYNISVEASSASGIDVLDVNLIVEEGVSSPVSLIAPLDNAQDLDIPVELSWNSTSSFGATYEVEIAANSDFSSIIETQNSIVDNNYTPTMLSLGQTYFWRVRVENPCGTSDYSDVRSFSTKSCNVYHSTDIPVLIPASGTPTITSSINITESGTVDQVDVLNLIGLHTWISDLVVRLISPAGTQVVLFSEICGNNQNFNLNFSDDAAPGNIPCPPTTGLTYQPVGSLANFNGEQMQGTWTLQIQDLANLDGGELQSWSLDICFTPDPCPAPSIEPSGIDVVGVPYCVGGELTLSTLGGSLAPGAQWEWFSSSCGGTPIGTGGTIQVSPTNNTNYFVRASSGTGCPESACTQLNFDVPQIGNSLSLDGDDATCVVNSGDWVHFYNAQGRLIASINSNGQDLGEVTASSFVNNETYLLGACDNPSDPNFINAVLARSFNITPSNQPTDPVTVRLYIQESEFTNYQAAALTSPNPNDDVNSLDEMNLTKHSGGNSTGVPSDVCNGGSVEYILQSQSGNTNAIFASISNSYFLEYQISSFSQFFPMNSGNSPLPVNLNSFDAICRDYHIEIKWQTSSETNASHFKLESSRDGFIWQHIATLDAAGNSSVTNNYQFNDSKIANTTLYYRLTQIDLDGQQTMYPPIQLSCEEGVNSAEVFPNPSQGSFHLAVKSAENFGLRTIQIMDVTGKAALEIEIDLQSGSYLIPFENLKLAQGVYVLAIRGLEEQFKPMRIVIGL